MKPQHIVFAMLSIALAACTEPPAPAQPAESPTPEETKMPAPAPQQAPMAKRAAGQEGGDPLQIFRAFGTEPFWNVNVEGTTLTWTTPEDQAGVVMQGERRVVTGGVEIAGNHAGKAFSLTVGEGMCSDGMSDNRYQLIATFRYGDADYRGCGEAAK